MKAVLDLTKAIKDRKYYSEQFEKGGTEKNILFVSPQLTAKHLYKYILPFFSFYNERVYTAITGLEKFNPFEQIVKINSTLNQQEILWANFIVFPFTTDELSKQNGLYEAIREVNPNAKIVFYVDFNYYQIPKGSQYHELFNKFPQSIENVEKNIIYSDLTITTNLQLTNLIKNKFDKLIPEKYSNIKNVKVQVGCIPYLIDPEIVLQNQAIDFEAHTPEPVINKDIFKKVAQVAEDLKAKDLKNNKNKAKKLKGKKSEPKKETAKSKKVKGKKDEEIKILEPKELPKKYRVGIICSPSNHLDIKYYNDQFQKINETYGDNVTLIFLGYDLEEDKYKILDGVNYEYVKPVSIIHYFKQLQSLNLDMVFIPMVKSAYNLTSENYNKYLECGLLSIPIMVVNLFPYNQMIIDKHNGYLYGEKSRFLEAFDEVVSNPNLMKQVGHQANADVIKNWTFTDGTIQVLSDIFQ